MTRKIKVYEKLVTRYLNYNRVKYRLIPQIILSGNWLENAGFLAGDSINVEVEENRIVITKVEA